MKPPMINQQIIQSVLNRLGDNTQLNLHLFESIDSTNRFLKELPRSLPSTLSCCVAETQTAGRGRFGRHWHSPFGEHIYCSFRWPYQGKLSALSGLSLVVSLAILAMLNSLSIADDIQIKWPNDLLWHGKKLCGTLIEMVGEHNQRLDVIIGIGLNVNSVIPPSPGLVNPWCSLIDITGKKLDRNELIGRLINQLQQHLAQFITDGFAAFMARWQRVDYLYDQMITVLHHTDIIEGRAKGVNAVGQLRLVDKRGAIQELSSGDTSLSAAIAR